MHVDLFDKDPKDGGKAEWITACCLPGVSSSVVSRPPHQTCQEVIIVCAKHLDGNESMCTYSLFCFCLPIVTIIG